MIEPRQPKFQWGQWVYAGSDLYNDGSYPDKEPEALLVAQGSRGEVVQVGTHEASNTPIYLVEFANGSVVGCFEEEISLEQPKSVTENA